jgi:hypothetical protein
MVLARKYKVALAVAASLTALGATAAYRELTQRPGEAALAYVPADALAAVSIDLSPSPAQVATFTSIDSALKAKGLSDMVQSGLISAILPKDLAGQVAPYVERAGAIALIPNPTATTKTDYQKTKIRTTTGPNLDAKNFIAYIGLTDSQAVANLLSKNLPARYLYGWTYYKVPNQDAYIAVVGEDLALAKDPWALFKTHRVQQGALASFTQSPDVQQARATVAADANVLFLVSPNLAKAAQPANDHNNYDHAWAAGSIVVQGDGIMCTFHGDAPNANPEFSLNNIKPLRQDLLACLPNGAYAVTAVDQLSQVAKTVAKGEKDFQKPLRKATGLDYDADILPAFQGNAVLAAYPAGDSNHPYGVNVLAILDDQNSANPAATARKLEAFAEEQMNKQAKGPHGALFAANQQNGATVYRLADNYQKEIKKGLKQDKPDEATKKLLDDKTFTWATVGNTVIVASSNELLKKALAAYQTHANTMADDARLASYAQAVQPGSQMLMLLSPARIAEGIEGTMDSKTLDKDSQGPFHDFMSMLKGLKAPLWANVAQSTDGHGTANLFIPMDYEKMIDLAGSQMNKGASAN